MTWQTMQLRERERDHHWFASSLSRPWPLPTCSCCQTCNKDTTFCLSLSLSLDQLLEFSFFLSLAFVLFLPSLFLSLSLCPCPCSRVRSDSRLTVQSSGSVLQHCASSKYLMPKYFASSSLTITSRVESLYSPPSPSLSHFFPPTCNSRHCFTSKIFLHNNCSCIQSSFISLLISVLKCFTLLIVTFQSFRLSHFISRDNHTRNYSDMCVCETHNMFNMCNLPKLIFFIFSTLSYKCYILSHRFDILWCVKNCWYWIKEFSFAHWTIKIICRATDFTDYLMLREKEKK